MAETRVALLRLVEDLRDACPGSIEETIPLARLSCREVVTESRRGRSHVATSWHLASRHRAPLALAPLAVEPAGEHGFVTAFLARWGEAVTGGRGRRGKSGVAQQARLL